MLIFIDPGHGGRDPGAIGPAKTQEKNNTLSEAQFLAAFLAGYQCDVRLTRNSDVSLGSTAGADLSARANAAKAAGASFFVSIHNDANISPQPHGATTYIYGVGGQAERIAHYVQPELAAFGFQDRGIYVANFAVLRETTKIPAILCETGFISNSEEERNLADPNFRQRIGEAIGRGIVKALGLQPKAAPKPQPVPTPPAPQPKPQPVPPVPTAKKFGLLLNGKYIPGQVILQTTLVKAVDVVVALGKSYTINSEGTIIVK
jgi:N-acetylmuramoyl-L-alanine amidase